MRPITIMLLVCAVSLAFAQQSKEAVEIRFYNVLPSVGEKISATRADTDGGRGAGGDFVPLAPVRPSTQQDAWKTFFEEMGVKWPPGSSLKYIPSTGKLMVANTPGNIEIFERILGQLNVVPFQLEIEVQFIAYELKRVEALGPTGVNMESLTSLWTRGQGRLIAAPKVVTQSGSEATSKGVTEYIYPTEFTVIQPVGTNTNTTVVASIVQPGGFETREVGAILSVVPEVSPEGSMINLTICPEYVEVPVWEDYGGDYVDSNGKKQRAHMRQPFFQTYSCSTSVSILSGARILVGGGMPTRDGKEVVYTFVSARKIGLDGKEMRGEKATGIRVPR